MAKILRKTDRLTVKIDDVTVKLAPLTMHQKVEIQTAMMNGRLNGDLKEATRGIVLCLKYGVKSIDGVEDSDGNPYVLKLEGEALSDETADDLMNLEITSKLSMVVAGMLNGIPSDFTDQNGKPIEGVKLVSSGKDTPEKNV